MADAGSKLQRWFAELRRRKVFRVAGVYLVAAWHAILGEHDRALELLDRAVRHGRGNLGWIERDTDFASLRGDPHFEAILGRLRAAAAGVAL